MNDYVVWLIGTSEPAESVAFEVQAENAEAAIAAVKQTQPSGLVAMGAIPLEHWKLLKQAFPLP